MYRGAINFEIKRSHSAPDPGALQPALLFFNNLAPRLNLDFRLPLIELDCAGDLDFLPFKRLQGGIPVWSGRNPPCEALVWVDSAKVDKGVPLPAR